MTNPVQSIDTIQNLADFAAPLFIEPKSIKQLRNRTQALRNRIQALGNDEKNAKKRAALRAKLAKLQRKPLTARENLLRRALRNPKKFSDSERKVILNAVAMHSLMFFDFKEDGSAVWDIFTAPVFRRYRSTRSSSLLHDFLQGFKLSRADRIREEKQLTLREKIQLMEISYLAKSKSDRQIAAQLRDCIFPATEQSSDDVTQERFSHSTTVTSSLSVASKFGLLTHQTLTRNLLSKLVKQFEIDLPNDLKTTGKKSKPLSNKLLLGEDLIVYYNAIKRLAKVGLLNKQSIEFAFASMENAEKITQENLDNLINTNPQAYDTSVLRNNLEGFEPPSNGLNNDESALTHSEHTDASSEVGSDAGSDDAVAPLPLDPAPQSKPTDSACPFEFTAQALGEKLSVPQLIALFGNDAHKIAECENVVKRSFEQKLSKTDAALLSRYKELQKVYNERTLESLAPPAVPASAVPAVAVSEADVAATSAPVVLATTSVPTETESSVSSSAAMVQAFSDASHSQAIATATMTDSSAAAVPALSGHLPPSTSATDALAPVSKAERAAAADSASHQEQPSADDEQQAAPSAVNGGFGSLFTPLPAPADAQAAEQRNGSPVPGLGNSDQA